MKYKLTRILEGEVGHQCSTFDSARVSASASEFIATVRTSFQMQQVLVKLPTVLRSRQTLASEQLY